MKGSEPQNSIIPAPSKPSRHETARTGRRPDIEGEGYNKITRSHRPAVKLNACAGGARSRSDAVLSNAVPDLTETLPAHQGDQDGHDRVSADVHPGRGISLVESKTTAGRHAAARRR